MKFISETAENGQITIRSDTGYTFIVGKNFVKIDGIFSITELIEIVAEMKRQIALKSSKMNRERAKELLPELIGKTATGISEPWRERMIEALEFVIERGDK